jgi:hypothetical protein
MLPRKLVLVEQCLVLIHRQGANKGPEIILTDALLMRYQSLTRMDTNLSWSSSWTTLLCERMVLGLQGSQHELRKIQDIPVGLSGAQCMPSTSWYRHWEAPTMLVWLMECHHPHGRLSPVYQMNTKHLEIRQCQTFTVKKYGPWSQQGGVTLRGMSGHPMIGPI